MISKLLLDNSVSTVHDCSFNIPESTRIPFGAIILVSLLFNRWIIVLYRMFTTTNWKLCFLLIQFNEPLIR